LQPRTNWPTRTSGSDPVGLTPVPWTEKQLKVAIFRSTRKSLLPRRPGWTEKVFFFFSGLQKLEQRPKKCIKLYGDYVEYIPSLAALGCFLPGRTKDLSAPPRIGSRTTFPSTHFRLL
jgi:hypothetical protein